MPLDQQPQAADLSSFCDGHSEETLPIRQTRKVSPPVLVTSPISPTPSSIIPSSVHSAQSDPILTDRSKVPNNALANQPSYRCIQVDTSVVGRRFRTNITCSKHTQVVLARQPDNPRDSNAIQVVDSARQAILGYLPKEIAQHLSGLLDAGCVQVSATLDAPKSVAAAVPILLQVSTAGFCLEIT